MKARFVAMLVYSHRDEPIALPGVFAHLLQDAVDASRTCTPSHDRLVDLLIDFGELECAIVDAACPERDDDTPLARQCRRAAIAIAQAVVASWKGDAGGVGPAMQAFVSNLRSIDAREIPARGRRRVAEGYAYYALYPEAYAAAALEFWHESRPARVCCIGIRSIGTSLSGIVAAALQGRGSIVRTITVRPRGAPQDRILRLTPELDRALAPSSDWHFAVIDEGPGQSGSTVAAVLSHLADRSVSDDRVVVFASHPVDPAALVSPDARRIWRRAKVYVGAFEGLGLEKVLANGGELADWSAGRWRTELYGDPARYPAVHPQHERRKYLLTARERVLMRFAGVGHYGRSTYQRACALADSGFTPTVDGIGNGFMRLRFIDGRPASAADISCRLLEQVAAYAAHLARYAATGRESAPSALLAMAVQNLAESVGHDRSAWFRAAADRLLSFEPAPEIAIDGRLLPHEWIWTGSTFVKTDAFDHHQDEFFPGPTDVAWDLAGASVEWNLTRDAESYLLNRYCRQTHDHAIHKRLPFFRIAYLAYRLGYAVSARKALRGLPDASRFAALAGRYRSRLLTEIDRLGCPSSGAPTALPSVP